MANIGKPLRYVIVEPAMPGLPPATPAPTFNPVRREVETEQPQPMVPIEVPEKVSVTR